MSNHVWAVGSSGGPRAAGRAGRRRSIPGAVLAASVAVIVAACSGTAASPTASDGSTLKPSVSLAPSVGASAPAAQACAGKKVALASTQKAGDQSVVDDMINNGLNKAKTDLGADTTLVETLDPASYEATLTNLANAGNDIIATTFLEMGEPLKAVAATFPNVRFIQIYGIAADPALPNLQTVSYRYQDATYLSGLLAGKITKTNTLGYEGGMFLPGINADYNAFKSAAMSVNPSVKVLAGEVGSFGDDAKAKEVVSALYAQGADIVQGDGPVIGLIEAAKEKDGLAIMGAPGLVDRAPERIPGVTFIYFGKSLFDRIADACSATYKGGHVESGVVDDITGFYVPEQFYAKADPALAAAVKAAMPAVEKAQADMKSGALVVPFDPAKP